MHDAYHKDTSKDIALLYLTYWGHHYKEVTGKCPTAETYARIWNGGPDGWKKRSTVKYWKKVKKEIRTRQNDK